MGYLALTVMCYNDSGGGAIWKAGEQYPPTKDSRLPRCRSICQNLRLKSAKEMSSEYIALAADRILVTGSNGFIGSKVVEKLLEYGFPNIRCFVRPSSKLGRLESALRRFEPGRNIELITGDLLSRDDCRRAAEGVSIIYHLSAGMEKSFAGAFMNSALATRNVMDAFLQFGKPKRFVNVSS